jgi:hypothetical protein
LNPSAERRAPALFFARDGVLRAREASGQIKLVARPEAVPVRKKS